MLNLDTMLRCKQILQEKTTHQVPAVTSGAGEKEEVREEGFNSLSNARGTTTCRPGELSVIFICSSPFHLALHSRQQGRNGKMKKIRRKCATVAAYLAESKREC